MSGDPNHYLADCAALHAVGKCRLHIGERIFTGDQGKQGTPERVVRQDHAERSCVCGLRMDTDGTDLCLLPHELPCVDRTRVFGIGDHHNAAARRADTSDKLGGDGGHRRSRRCIESHRARWPRKSDSSAPGRLFRSRAIWPAHGARPPVWIGGSGPLLLFVLRGRSTARSGPRRSQAQCWQDGRESDWLRTHPR